MSLLVLPSARRWTQTVWWLLLLCAQAASSQTAPAANSTLTSASSSSPVTISGQVISASSGSPVFRALVQMNDLAVLTDHEGHFDFDTESAGTATTLRVNKPGFYGSPDGESASTLSIQPTQAMPVTVRLYPEALITGSVTTRDGAPVPDVLITPQRSLYTDQGQQWIPMPPRQTNSRGEYRIVVPAGDYRLETSSGTRQTTSGQSILPQMYPSNNSSGNSGYLHVGSGQEEHADFHADPVPTFTIPIRLEPDSGRGYASLTAATETGAVFPVPLVRNGANSAIEMPSGSYVLTAMRMRSDGVEFAQASVTVSGPGSQGVTLNFVSVSAIPVQLVVDSQSTSDNVPLPTVAQLGLHLSPADQIPSTMRVAPYSGDSFRPTPGRYRLFSRGGGTWFIKSASYGSADLLQQEMLVAPGAGSSPIIVTVSNQTGSLSGTVNIGGTLQSAWVYLIPNFPSATPFYSVHSASNGSFSLNSLPPGSYRAIAFEVRSQVDYHSSAMLEPYASYLNTVTVTTGGKASVDIDGVPAAEMHP
ncbi:MAG: hypothetical protein PW789_01715 [Edaphobacter sp.]|uniref:hypothetical protein n=1 Tax=Edaphobacter sp. TaxID=1934404 RepID=UPI0023A1EC67|nr:hypothetical protein [Edaphobacter sp.]MDE1175307.1 hypothetical protein [Edaphobacter sp.]